MSNLASREEPGGTLVATVRQWTGWEARALRLAQRMSVRRYAEHLGITAAAVSSWEQRGTRARLRYETQRMLDTDLARSTEDVRARFERELTPDETSEPTTKAVPSLDQTADGGGTAELVVSPTRTDLLGPRSAQRTRALLNTVRDQYASLLDYCPPVDPATLVADFVESSARVLVVSGPPGSGKTLLARRIAGLSGGVAIQLHAADTWYGRANDDGIDLAREILRYASLDGDPDALLTLERTCVSLANPLMVVIDGMRTSKEITDVCRSTDRILRQVLSAELQFLLVFRTPPDVELSAYPVLAASVFHPNPTITEPAVPCRTGDASLRLSRWEPAEAGRVWDACRAAGATRFCDLPARVRDLARLPLYMHLIKRAGGYGLLGATSAYRLLDFCARSILRSTSKNTDTVMTALGVLAEQTLTPAASRGLLSRLSPAGPAVPETDNGGVTAEHLAGADSLLAWDSVTGTPRFHHDILGEFFFANRLVTLLAGRGRAAATIDTLDELAGQAATSPAAHGVLEFVIQGLDATDPDLLAEIALSPMIAHTATLPALFRLAGSDAAFASDDVVATCARSSVQDRTVALARILLCHPRLRQALSGAYATWLTEVLRLFGSTIWPDLADHIERQVSAPVAREILAAANLGSSDEAIFFARHAHLFFSDDPPQSELLRQLHHHPDWRVRAALADGIRRQPTSAGAGLDPSIGLLARDRDYKVRAATAAAVGRSSTSSARRQAAALLTDPNWHVRERLLRSVLAEHNVVLSDVVADAVRNDAAWQGAPMQVRTELERLLLLGEHPSVFQDASARSRALFGLLREHRIGTRVLPEHLTRRLLDQAMTSGDCLLEREAAAHLPGGSSSGGCPPQARGLREHYRRLRDQRGVQVALDLHDLDQALVVAEAAAAASVTFVEVGDPLIKSAGVTAIGQVKRRIPKTMVVAEMMSADWGRDQVVLAAEAGADVVMLIGCASVASVTAAVGAGTRLGVPILLDVPTHHLDREWVRDMERAGVDGLAITTNIDLGVANTDPLTQARLLRSWTSLPVAVSGGFGTTDRTSLRCPDWDILIVGRAVTDALSPAAAVRQLLDLIHPERPNLATPREDHDHCSAEPGPDPRR